MSKEKEGEYSVLEVNGVRYVLVKLIRNGTAHPQPNFMGTGFALVAILKKRETLKSFLQMIPSFFLFIFCGYLQAFGFCVIFSECVSCFLPL